MTWLKDDSGAALITVMMLVAMISSIAMASFGVLKDGIQRSVRDQTATQAREYALAAELIGAEKAEELVKNASLLTTLGINKNVGKITAPIDHGELVGKLTDHSNCFNLTALVMPSDNGGYQANNFAGKQFARLLMAIGLGDTEAHALVAALTDWQDSNNRPQPFGAEDGAYSLLDNPYRVNNHPIAGLRELRLVKGYSEALIQALKPFVCVESTLETQLNINSIETHQAVLISALLGGELSIRDVTRLIDDRPAGGYETAAHFWQHDILKNRNISQSARAQINFEPIRFLLTIDVKIVDARQRLTSLIRFHPDGSYRLVRRQFGVSEL